MYKRRFLSQLFVLLLLTLLTFSITSNAKASGAVQTQLVPEGFIGIYSVENLYDIRNDLSGNYILMNDIDLSEVTSEGGKYFNDSAGWLPIGEATSPFSGKLNGNGYKIIGLKINLITDKVIYAGLFGHAKDAEISNLGMVESNIFVNNNSLESATSAAYAGSIMAIGNNVSIQNTYSTGTIKAQSYHLSMAGGLAAKTTAGIISNGYNSAEISGKNSVGGLVAEANNTKFIDITNNGTVFANTTFFAGGIVGSITNKSVIENAHNTGNIESGISGGGIVGFSLNSVITNSTNEGRLLSKKFLSHTGGIVGRSDNSLINKVCNKGLLKGISGGGIAGRITNNTFIKDSVNTGDITASVYGAGISGEVEENSSIETSNNSGEINLSWDTRDLSGGSGGGISGKLSNSSITGTYNNGKINGKKSGGIVGESKYANVSKSYNNGEVFGSEAGGIAGSISYTTINDSFNTGHINGHKFGGGITGEGTNYSIIKTTYNVGVVEKWYMSNNSGGIAGKYDAMFQNNYYLDNILEAVFSGTYEGATLIKHSEMQQTTAFKGFDFSTTWRIEKDSGYPYPLLSGIDYPQQENKIRVEMTSNPNKVVYAKGEEIDLTGAAIQVKTTHGNEYTIPVTQEMVSGYNSNTVGNQLLTVKYENFTFRFNIEVKDIFTVNFTDYNGKPLKTEKVVAGNSATAPADPIRPGYTFSGWSRSFENVNFSLTVTANYIINSYTINFMDEHTIMKSAEYTSIQYIYRPTDLSKPGYTLFGWYTEPNLINEYVFPKYAKGNLNLYAKFIKNPLPLENLSNDPNIRIDSIDHDKLKVSFNKVEDVDGYEIYGSIDSEYEIKRSYQFNATNEKTESFILEYLIADFPYYFKIRSYKMIDGHIVYSPYTSELSGTPTLPTAKLVKAVSIDFDQIKISWLKPDYEDGSYEIYRSDTLEGEYTKVGAASFGGTPTYIDKNLISGKKYYYKIKAYKMHTYPEKVYSDYSEAASAIPTLNKSTAVKSVTTEYNKIKLSWSKVNGSMGYEVYRSNSQTGTYNNIKTIIGNSVISYEDTGLVTGKMYYYKIRAYRTIDGKKVYSPFSSVVNAQPALVVATSVKAVSAGYSKNKVSWAQVSGATGYEVYRAISKTGSYSRVKTLTAGSSLSYENTGLSTGKIYYYKVRVYRVVAGKNVYGSYSGIVSATPNLAVPSKITAAKASTTAIKTSWAKVGEASGYEVYRATTTTGTYTKVKTLTTVSSLTFTNTGLAKGKTYYYKVRAYRVVSGKKIYSPYTTIVSAKL